MRRLALVALATTLTTPALAQDTLAGPTEYAVKIVCGRTDRRAVAPGTYYTAINVHNPNPDSVPLRKKVALTAPGEKPGLVYPFSNNILVPDQAFEIDCADIIRHSDSTLTFAKGFVVIQSRAPLDVVAVYTTAGATRLVQTMTLERVPGRPIRRM